MHGLRLGGPVAANASSEAQPQSADGSRIERNVGSILLALPSTVPIAKALQLIKGGSSKWSHENFPEHALFAWQEKYGAFTVSVSQLSIVTRYIRTQAEHHRKTTFEQEFLLLLKKHRIEFDEKYLWK